MENRDLPTKPHGIPCFMEIHRKPFGFQGVFDGRSKSHSIVEKLKWVAKYREHLKVSKKGAEAKVIKEFGHPGPGRVMECILKLFIRIPRGVVLRGGCPM